MKKEQIRQELLSHWSIQEHLLQSYRILFVVSQSILFGIASLVLNSQVNTNLYLTLEFIGLIELWFWYSICNTRAKDVSYFQLKIMEIENSDDIDISETDSSILNSFKKWQTQTPSEKNKILKSKGLYKSKTRTKMEKGLPLIFLIAWIIVSIITFSK